MAPVVSTRLPPSLGLLDVHSKLNSPLALLPETVTMGDQLHGLARRSQTHSEPLQRPGRSTHLKY